jgi:hypothetical protein
MKPTEILKTIIAIPLALLLAVELTLAVLLFSPDQFADALALREFREAYRVFLGPAFLLLSIWAVARLLSSVWRLGSAPLQRRRNLRKMQEQLHALTPEEKGYLAHYVIDGNTTLYASMDDGIAGGLMARRIIFRTSNIASLVDGAPFNLQPWVRDYLTSHPEILADAEGRPIPPREKLFGSRW